jgi:hypothetical protein
MGPKRYNRRGNRRLIVAAKTGIREFVHQALNQRYGGSSGYYIPRKEVRLSFSGREILYITGRAVVESSCCGNGKWDYVLVPGFIVDWHSGANQSGLAVTSVEPLEDTHEIKELTSLIVAKEKTNCITFW